MGGVSIKLQNITSVKESLFTFDITNDISLFELLNSWGALHAPELPGRVFCAETGIIASTMMVIINGRSVKSDDPKTTMVSPGDEILITPIIVGG